ncbi:hypothetical protein LINGRAHAP2_LOCUS29813 [Linum grandiflorum]
MRYVAARELPAEIEEKIAKEHLTTFHQLVSFSGVCRSWRSIAKEINISSVPGILVSNKSCPDKRCKEDYCNLDECRNSGRCRRCNTPHYQFRPISTIFNSTITGSGVASHHPPPPPLPLMWSPQDCATTRTVMLRGPYGFGVDLEKCHCMGSKDGWLVLAQQYSLCARIYLLNPITGASIQLPPLEYEGDIFDQSHVIEFHVAVLSSSPDDHDCHLIVLTQYSPNYPKIAWCKVRGGCWKFSTRYKKCVNVIDNFINVTDDDEVVVPRVRSFPFPFVVPRPGIGGYPMEILYPTMELNGQLILVHAETFRVYKLVVANVSCDGKLVEHSRLSTNIYQDYTWLLPMPWDIHKHLKNFKKEKMPPQPKDIDPEGFERIYKTKKTNYDVWHRQQRTDNQIIPCHNRFKGLPLDD